MKKRILVLLCVLALMVVMLATSVAPAFAAWDPTTGCREGHVLFPADSLPPDLASVDGKRTADGFVCLTFHDRQHVYDNRPVTPP